MGAARMSGLVTRRLLTSARAASTRRLLAPGASRLMSSSGPASPFGEAYFKLRGYNQYGRLHDDLQDLRNFRISRAMQCSVGKTVLPKDEWTTYEDDQKNGKYLQPYIDEIEAEDKERSEWGKM